jgi:L-fucose mutarotase
MLSAKFTISRSIVNMEDVQCYVERFAFCEQAKKAYAIIATGDSALYANIILKKGAVA